MGVEVGVSVGVRVGVGVGVAAPQLTTFRLGGALNESGSANISIMEMASGLVASDTRASEEDESVPELLLVSVVQFLTLV